MTCLPNRTPSNPRSPSPKNTCVFGTTNVAHVRAVAAGTQYYYEVRVAAWRQGRAEIRTHWVAAPSHPFMDVPGQKVIRALVRICMYVHMYSYGVLRIRTWHRYEQDELQLEAYLLPHPHATASALPSPGWVRSGTYRFLLQCIALLLRAAFLPY